MEIIPVIFHKDPDGWWADSPSISGWTATAPTLDELRSLAEEGVRFALDRDDVIMEPCLEYGVPAYADVTFDFLSGQTVVHPRLQGRVHDGAHWQAQVA